MRLLIEASLPVETGNAAIRDGSLGQKMQSILEDQKPEAVYFIEENGKRTVILVVNAESGLDIPRLAEPWFLAFNAHLEVHPAFVPEEMADLGPILEPIVKKYG